MSIEASKVQVDPWWHVRWTAAVARLRRRRPKSGRELAQERMEKEWSPGDGLFAIVEWIFQSWQLAILGMFVTGLTAAAAVFYFSHPGLVEWIAGVFVENCRVNHVCDFGTNMAAFSVANLILVEFCVFFAIMILGAADHWDDEDAMDRMQGLDSSQMSIVGEVGDLRDQVEALRHELLAIPPDDEPARAAAGPMGDPDVEQPY